MPQNYKRHKKGRRQGTSVYYTPQETERYQSQYLRYQRAVEKLKGNDMILFQESPLLARFRSKRSPVGYWEISGLEAEKNWENRIFNINGGGGDIETKAFFDSNLISDLDATFSIGSGFTTIETGASSLTQSITYEVNGSAALSLGTLFPVNCELSIDSIKGKKIKVIINLSGDTPDPGSIYHVRAEILFNSFGGTFILLSKIIELPGTDIFEEEIMLEDVEYQLNLTISFLSDVGIASGSGILIPFSGEILIDGLAEQGCNCPDKTKQVAANPQSPYLSEQIARDWTASAAGTPDKCWHEWAVEILTNPDIEVPTDVPELR